jgi:hypothetical protein
MVVLPDWKRTADCWPADYGSVINSWFSWLLCKSSQLNWSISFKEKDKTMSEFCIYDEMGELDDEHMPSFPREKKIDMAIYEDDGGAAVAGDFATKQLMSHGMALALGWVSEGDFSFDALDTFIQGYADLDGDGEVQEDGDEENYYNDLFGAVGDAFVSLGADTGAIGKFIGDEDSDAGASIGAMLSEKIGAMETSDEDIISDYVLGAAGDGEQIMESMIKKVIGGTMSWGKKKLKRMHHQITSELRAALKKARFKAHTAGANRNRKHSMKIREKMDL